MPGTASTRTTDRDRLRSRLILPRASAKSATAGVLPSEPALDAAVRLPFGATRGGSAQAEQSPILFRLPAIAPAEPDDNIAAACEPQSGEPSHRGLSEPTEIRNEDEVTLDITRVEPQVHFQPPGPQLPSQPSSSQPEPNQPSAKDEDIADQLQLASRVEASQVESSRVAATAPTTEANSEPRRTWWEHWSSGVVLILLVIALVVASIIALNDGGKVGLDQLASQRESSTLDEFDLSTIAIPAISMPPLSATTDRPLSSIVQGAPNSPGVAPSAPAPETPAGAASSGSEIAEVPAAEKTATENTASLPIVAERVAVDTAAEEGLVVALADEGEVVPVGPADQTAPQLAAPVASESIPPLPLATLDLPTEVAAPQLFAPEEMPDRAGASTPPHRISSMPASSPTVSLELPQAEVIRAEGSSPTFYDGASIAGEQHAVASSAGPVDTNMPSIFTVLASATTSVDSSSAPAAQVVTSATPDLNGESIVEAYLRFKQLHQATTEPASNRYPTPPASK